MRGSRWTRATEQEAGWARSPTNRRTGKPRGASKVGSPHVMPVWTLRCSLSLYIHSHSTQTAQASPFYHHHPQWVKSISLVLPYDGDPWHLRNLLSAVYRLSPTPSPVTGSVNGSLILASFPAQMLGKNHLVTHLADNGRIVQPEKNQG